MDFDQSLLGRGIQGTGPRAEYWEGGELYGRWEERGYNIA